MKQSASPPAPLLSLPALTSEQQVRLYTYADLLVAYNQKVNLISRKSEADVYERHLAHCLVLAARSFAPGSAVADWGTGGGLPALPLAILFPDVRFYAVDSIRKKTDAVRHFAAELGLSNLEVWNGRAEDFPHRVHYAVSRATAPLEALWRWYHRAAVPCGEPEPGCWPYGLLCLKGGDLSEEQRALRRRFPAVRTEQVPLAQVQGAPPGEDKYLLIVSEKAGG